LKLSALTPLAFLRKKSINMPPNRKAAQDIVFSHADLVLESPFNKINITSTAENSSSVENSTDYWTWTTDVNHRVIDNRLCSAEHLISNLLADTTTKPTTMRTTRNSAASDDSYWAWRAGGSSMSPESRDEYWEHSANEQDAVASLYKSSLPRMQEHALQRAIQSGQYWEGM
jgi:hypothetical protein